MQLVQFWGAAVSTQGAQGSGGEYGGPSVCVEVLGQGLSWQTEKPPFSEEMGSGLRMKGCDLGIES